jgi:hypothetical protein
LPLVLRPSSLPLSLALSLRLSGTASATSDRDEDEDEAEDEKEEDGGLTLLGDPSEGWSICYTLNKFKLYLLFMLL